MPEDDDRNRLIDVQLDETTFVRRTPEVEHERAVAIYDLLEENRFALVGDKAVPGPYKLNLSLRDSRLVLDIRDTDDEPIRAIILALKPFQKIVKDYFLICESYFNAIKTLPPTQIEAIDMGRRGIHNEGSDLLQDRLREHVAVDHDTARRLFTLLCVLHMRG